MKPPESRPETVGWSGFTPGTGRTAACGWAVAAPAIAKQDHIIARTIRFTSPPLVPPLLGGIIYIP